MGRFLLYLLLALVVIGVGFYIYQRNIAPVPVVASDLDKGGAFSDDEKTGLKTACMAFMKKDPDKVCGCIMDKAGTDFSRFDREIMTATFKEKLSDIVGLTKGLVDSGIPMDKMKAAESDSKQRLSDLMKTCGSPS